MRITGTAHMNAPVPVAWKAFHDPGVLSRTIPGVKRLTETGRDAYALSVMAGVASIKGVYEGDVALSEQVEHESFLLTANGAGGPGTIGAKVRVQLAEAEDGGTDLEYEADAIVGGAIGGVGQRMLGGVAKRMAGQFFAAIDRDIARGGAADPIEGAPAGEDGAAVATPAATVGAGAVTETAGGTPTSGSATQAAPTASAREWGSAPSPRSTPPAPGEDTRVPFWVVLAGVGAGAFWALAGVAVGHHLAGRAEGR